ncbi:hypothetical protein ACIB24_12445 [Spongisporangium articulatum]|uniref:Oligosaccharide repeat unit polymerase n=1 Tax=Spongisporangium articulatum TaxID=3362603 RepID=A0ABW8ANB9_9ACTN
MSIATAARRFNLPLAVFWAWVLVFMGLAPAYQLSQDAFPWLAELPSTVVSASQRLVLIGCAASAAACWAIGKRQLRPKEHELNLPVAAPRNIDLGQTLKRISYGYSFITTGFIALMGGSLFHARADFRQQVLAIAQLPLGGTMYFIVTAGAILVPSLMIVAWRFGIVSERLTVAAPLITAGIATNPLLGSRFLTGSFLVSVGAAALGRHALSRLLPAASVVLLVVLFPSLDTLRGDGTGSQKVQIVAADESLTTYNFDAFEMLMREQSLSSSDRSQLPSSLKLAIAPVVRWVPLLARPYIGLAGGAVVADATGMQYTNVSMPLWGEGDLLAGIPGTIVLMAGLGAWFGVASRPTLQLQGESALPSELTAPATAALLFIVLRGSLYEVLGYLLLVIAVYRLSNRRLSKMAVSPADPTLSSPTKG